MIFQQSSDTSVLPTGWKTAHVVPIFKKGDCTYRANYRPISLTSVPSKIMESIIKMNFLNSWSHMNEIAKNNVA